MPQISPPVNLGAVGLAGSAVFQAYLQVTPSGVAAPVDPSAIALSPLLSFLGAATTYYQLTGLPDPVPGGMGTVIVSSALGDALREYTYGLPSPAPLVLYRAEVTITENGPFTSSDTLGLIALDIVGLPDPTTATITFGAKSPADIYILQDRPAAASDIVQLSDNSYSFTLTYSLEPGHPIAISPPLGAITLLYGEFRLDYGSGRIKCLPGDNSLILRVRRALQEPLPPPPE